MADEKLNTGQEQAEQPSLFEADPADAPAQNAPTLEPPAPEKAPEQAAEEPPEPRDATRAEKEEIPSIIFSPLFRKNSRCLYLLGKHIVSLSPISRSGY